MTIFDYIVIGGYLAFMLALGPVYKSFSKTASDFFRGGGGMLWWVVGSSAFMTTFSAWSFTGGAAKAYETGTFFLVLFACNILSLVVCYFLTASKFRQMRVVTAVEGIRKRFGETSEQVYTWLPILFHTFFGGVMLYTISVFMSGIFNFSMELNIIVLGVVVVGMTLIGGSWAATAGDFVQMLIVTTITIMMAVLTLKHGDIGGLTGLIEKVPETHFDWTEFARPGVIIFFIITLAITQTVNANSMLYGAARYIFVKDGKDAKKAVLVSIVGFAVLAPVWMIPVMGSAVLFPDLSSTYSQLNNPNEAAYVAIAMELLPPGLLGLLVCGIFAASLTTMNSFLNIFSGTFVRNFYIRVLNPKASELKQILVGRCFIFVYGASWIAFALVFKNIKSLELFDLILLASASLGLPSGLPMAYGLFFKKTPDWAGWATMLGGFVVSVGARFVLTDEFMQRCFGQELPLNARELGDMNIALTTAAIFTVCTVCFFGSMLFYKKTTDKSRVRIDSFFKDINTPLEAKELPGYEGDKRQLKVMGTLCMVYGGLTLLILAVPNSLQDRFLIFVCGGFVACIGGGLLTAAKRLNGDSA